MIKSYAFLPVALSFFLTITDARAGDESAFELPVHNQFSLTCTLWWYGMEKGCRRDWNNVQINRERTRTVSFVGDDPFALVVRLGRVERSLGYVNLRQYAQGNPAKELILSGGYLAKTQYVYNRHRRRWEWRQVRDGYVVHADLVLQDGTSFRISGYGQDMPNN